MRILIVEDDQNIARSLRRALRAEHYDVDLVTDGALGAERAISGDYDLILLDLLLPGMDGFEILRRVRRVHEMIPVLIISSRSGVKTRIRCLEMGADDYLVKPFTFAELHARIRAVVRRTGAQFRRELRIGKLELDRVEHVAAVQDNVVDLTQREFQLLEYFMQNPDEPLTRAMVADRVWGHQFGSDTNVIDVYVNYLRKKLLQLGLKPVRTVRGIGYSLDSSKCQQTLAPE